MEINYLERCKNILSFAIEGFAQARLASAYAVVIEFVHRATPAMQSTTQISGASGKIGQITTSRMLKMASKIKAIKPKIRINRRTMAPIVRERSLSKKTDK